MNTAAPGEVGSNPLFEAAAERLRQTIARFDPSELAQDPEATLHTALEASRWLLTWTESRFLPLKQAHASMQFGFAAVRLETDTPSVVPAIARGYRLSEGFREHARDIISRVEDPAVRSVIFFRHGMVTAAKLKRERAASA